MTWRRGRRILGFHHKHGTKYITLLSVPLLGLKCLKRMGVQREHADLISARAIFAIPLKAINLKKQHRSPSGTSVIKLELPQSNTSVALSPPSAALRSKQRACRRGNRRRCRRSHRQRMAFRCSRPMKPKGELGPDDGEIGNLCGGADSHASRPNGRGSHLSGKPS